MRAGLGRAGQGLGRSLTPLLAQDSYPRFLKSELYRNLLAEAVIPPETKKR